LYIRLYILNLMLSTGQFYGLKIGLYFSLIGFLNLNWEDL